MASKNKKNLSGGAKKCVCSVCLLECNSTIADTPHRRCSGNSENNTIRPKSELIPANARGKWS